MIVGRRGKLLNPGIGLSWIGFCSRMLRHKMSARQIGLVPPDGHFFFLWHGLNLLDGRFAFVWMPEFSFFFLGRNACLQRCLRVRVTPRSCDLAQERKKRAALFRRRPFFIKSSGSCLAHLSLNVIGSDIFTLTALPRWRPGLNLASMMARMASSSQPAPMPRVTIGSCTLPCSSTTNCR